MIKKFNNFINEGVDDKRDIEKNLDLLDDNFRYHFSEISKKGEYIYLFTTHKPVSLYVETPDITSDILLDGGSNTQLIPKLNNILNKIADKFLIDGYIVKFRASSHVDSFYLLIKRELGN